MLALLFYLGDEKYTIKCGRVREIAPMVSLKEMPNSPEFFAGLFNYRGMIVPVIDLRQLIQGCPCQIRLSTRIILVDYVGPDNMASVFGLMAERVTEAVMKPEDALVAPSVNMQNAPYLGGIVMEQNTMIQYIDVELLPGSLHFLPMLESGAANVAADH